MKSTCMNCRYYRIEDELSGYCRMTVAGKTAARRHERPLVRQDHFCNEWRDCGQQYYIRLGWLKSRKNTPAGPN